MKSAIKQRGLDVLKIALPMAKTTSRAFKSEGQGGGGWGGGCGGVFVGWVVGWCVGLGVGGGRFVGGGCECGGERKSMPSQTKRGWR